MGSDEPQSTLDADAVLARKLQRQYNSEATSSRGPATPESPSSRRLVTLPDKPVSTSSKWKMAARKAVSKNGGGLGVAGPQISGIKDVVIMERGSRDPGEGLKGMAGIALCARQHGGRGGSGGKRIFAPVNEQRLLNDDKVTEFLGELAEYLWREQASRVPSAMRGRSLVPSDEAAMLSSAIEDCMRCIVVSPHESRHLYDCKRASEKKDAELKRRTHLLRGRSQADFGVPEHVVSSTEWADARSSLSRFDQDDSTDPEYRLELLLESKNAVEAEYARESKSQGRDPGAKPLAADDYMPVFSYIVAHMGQSEDAGVNLNGVISFLRDCSSGTGETGYFLTMLEAALEHVMTLDIAKERIEHNKSQMEDLQKMLEKSGFLDGGKLSDSIFQGQAREATKPRLKRRG